jgi:hypothetical protein
MGIHHLRIVWVDNRCLKGATEKILGIPHEILIQRIGLADENDHRLAIAAAHSAAALPGVDNGTGITHKDAGIETADINAHLQGACGDNPGYSPRGQSMLNFAPLLREETSAI